MSEETFLPVATANDLPAGSTTVPVAEAVAALADVLTTEPGDPTQVRIGTVTSITDPNTAGRVQLDITSTAWCYKSADISLRVGDRVCVLQQGPVFIVIARIGASEAHPVGALLQFAGATAPAGWLICDGSSKLRTDYPALFAVIGTTYGSVDGTHFTLPDLRNKVAVGSGSTYSRGQTGGAATVTLTTTTMPSHSHSLSGTASSAGSHSHGGSTDSNGDHSHSESQSGNRSDILAGGGTNVGTQQSGSTGSAGSHSHGISTDSQGSHSHSLSGSVASNGSDGAHENMPPFVAMPYIIRAL